MTFPPPSSRARPLRKPRERLAHGRPQEVLRYIDWSENPKRDLVVNFGSVTDAFRVYPDARAAWLAAEERYRDQYEEVAGLTQVVAGLSRLVES